MKRDLAKLRAWQQRSRKPLPKGKIVDGKMRVKKLGKGRKVKEWDGARAELKKAFAAVGITRCEICGTDWALSFAHARKRRNLAPGELYVCALICIPHHDELEVLPEAEMCARIHAIIDARTVQPVIPHR